MILETMVIEDIFKALGDPTRLRIARLLGAMELAVGELAQVLGQSQPRVSRHVGILVDAGLVERQREGAWVFLRRCQGPASAAIDALAAALPPCPRAAAQAERDRAALDAVQAARMAGAARWFAEQAGAWERFRALYAPEEEVERAMAQALGPRAIGRLLDVGSGTGRMVELFGQRSHGAIALDHSPEMLRIARAKLTAAGSRVEFVRGDFHQLPLADASIDTAILHHVLHFAREPERVIAEVARVLPPGGVALIADFAPHQHGELRHQAAHLHLGFAHEDIRRWCAAHALRLEQSIELGGAELVMCVWTAKRLADGGHDAGWSRPGLARRAAA